LLNSIAAQDDVCCSVAGEYSTAPRRSDVAYQEVCRNNLNYKACSPYGWFNRI